MDIRDAFYHGVYHNIKRVITAMSDEEIDRGLSAFEDGGKNWAECFFARAFKPTFETSGNRDPERAICEHLGLVYPSGLPNRIPVKTLYTMFDEAHGSILDRKQLYNLIVDIRDDRRPKEVMGFLASLNFNQTTIEAPKLYTTACSV